MQEDHISYEFIPVENENENNNYLVHNTSEFNSVETIWSTSDNITLSTQSFIHVEGPIDETNILIKITSLLIFKLLFTTKLIELITFHTHLYFQQRSKISREVYDNV